MKRLYPRCYLGKEGGREGGAHVVLVVRVRYILERTFMVLCYVGVSMAMLLVF